ncbi:MAG: nitrous oxide reductase family maturation protein NosD [Verrucomicrobiales bacterium]|nr:nitrous oxide reductase family maturation protein NosD [Verrucomicrobiales bacterium]
MTRNRRLRFLSLLGCCASVLGAASAAEPLQSLIDAEAPGSTLRLAATVYTIDEAVNLNKPLSIEGSNGTIIDGQWRDTLMLIGPDASGSTVRGIMFRNGGRSSTREWAGIRIDGASRVTIEDNQFMDCNYGIYLAKAADCVLQGNTVTGKPGIEQNSGNGIHLWSSQRVAIRGNDVSGHRDGIYLEFSGNTLVEENAVHENTRYGLHFMSANDCRYVENRFTANGAGVAVMYSTNVEMTGNLFEKSWGGSAYGLLLKDIRDSHITDNTFHANSTGVYAQGVTRTRFERNLLRENGWALRLLSDGTENEILDNDFIRNSFDFAVNGQLISHRIAGNYWDRYEGYDLRRDGDGDVPYRPVSLYGMLTERVPASLVLLHSFMVQLIDRAERAFPSITPESVVDESPAMKPRRPVAGGPASRLP